MIALRVTRRPGATEPDAEALVLPPEGITIGRAEECGLVLADPLRMVSRQHAQVFAVGEIMRIRCVSSRTPLWVNGAQIDPGNELTLLVGDRLRICGFELAVETVAAAVQRSRVDRWFDLDGALDPLAAESPLPALAPSASSPSPESTAVVSWQTSRHVVRTGAPTPRPVRAESARTTGPAPLAPAAAPLAATAVASSGATRAASPAASPDATPGATPAATPPASAGTRAASASANAAPVPANAAPARRVARHAADLSPELQELAAAFARGAGLGPEVAPLTPEWMEHLGALLRETAEGTLALLKSRAVAKRHMRAEGTQIAPRENNPLKFSPDATEALTRMLQRDPSHGFLDPVAALRDAHRDLLVHQVAMVAGMRAAVFELFSRLSPEAAETIEGPAHGMSRLPSVRAAALWHRHCMQHAHLLEHLDDDFQTIFGREFLRAYEAQSRTHDETNPSPLEPPWPAAR
ncbi:type VI secretion system-associated FHA domain protein TagH [Variovorax sp. J22R133]|uniref:type VI secretion system-associated FHA domain protein TagH n=1 Tax=Variovorax brevis TaxID=3053503 RepID=UPI002575E519|nr:type VI secretion system-associated FHA domain protein TagH [Variovorax sp. J22R133]MDM0115678.1 type VI secretion system-associated FHA domain protein TagH [Variovorax sp. J22R133]